MSYQLQLESSQSFAAQACEYLVHKWGPIYMRAGGGCIAQEGSKFRAKPQRTTPEQKARILELAREGRWTGTEIARMTGTLQSAAHKIIAAAGISVPDGRRNWTQRNA